MTVRRKILIQTQIEKEDYIVDSKIWLNSQYAIIIWKSFLNSGEYVSIDLSFVNLYNRVFNMYIFNLSTHTLFIIL